MLTHTKLKKMKEEKDPIVMLTAYDYPSAKLAESSGVDMILVGDSLGMVVLGYDSTIPVTVEDMVHHGKAVRRGAKETYMVVDMPFMSYHSSLSETMDNAKRLMQETGAQSLKLEGAGDVLPVIHKLTKSGVPVVAHLGLTPQSVNVLGGYRVQGKDLETAETLLQEARQVEENGAIALVLECVPQQLARRIQEELSIPVIGIGAGVGTDGQVLVYHDVVEYGVERLPKFVKSYADLNTTITVALTSYVEDVKKKEFPADSHSFQMKEELIPSLYGGSGS
ncbi:MULTISPECIES: 3-methyl-2-oxobutanoate hydroxymethyltransferase [Pontibacillus]|uniref:3-methyl-2-oxobutanoate hydroxymethyltransferase n=1 Tax=Pontibacillus chungwhensis TaxID=265426 RepID=A0ABY8UUD0_9BACI|nr:MULTISPECIES: 3-methyl-2-oxobutanoate hydroxymethyltransferase [Pontibacillus]MCD5322967.1 3-methyl-2-oxobutanoate hydroxymethyltransferase [Pontibacillus sp. HN14]WIF96361.1 3-methyl-2-oxobutanoate hydroxymethyltransferase [Pontibacillus chungwhensis]